MLATPVNRAAMIGARVMHASLTVTIQSAIILIVGLVLGARIEGGVSSVVAILLLAGLLGAGFAAISSGAAILLRRDERLGQDWASVWTNVGLLAAFVLVATLFSSQAFRAYRRAV